MLADVTWQRRQHFRTRITQPVTVRLDETSAALIADLGEGGVGVHALSRRLGEGALLRMEFHLPGINAPITARGVVTWVSESAEAGIQFVEPPEGLGPKLRQWIAQNEFSSAAREFFKLAGGLRPAIELLSELVRTLTSASGIAITIGPGETPASPEGTADARIANSRQTVYSTDEQAPAGSKVCVPLYREEDIIGHMEVVFPGAGAFEDEDIGPLQAFAAVLSEMMCIRETELREAAKRASRLTARIIDRIDRAFPNLLGRAALPRWAAR
jgi:hypothetical protein